MEPSKITVVRTDRLRAISRSESQSGVAATIRIESSLSVEPDLVQEIVGPRYRGVHMDVAALGRSNTSTYLLVRLRAGEETDRALEEIRSRLARIITADGEIDADELQKLTPIFNSGWGDSGF